MSSKKKMSLTDQIVLLRQNLIRDYNRWVHLFTCGGSDPSYEDGVNINLVHNHIYSDKRKIEEVLRDNFVAYPDEYFYPEPIYMPDDFMAVSRTAPILASFKRLASSEVPENRHGFMSLSQVIFFNWKEVLC